MLALLGVVFPFLLRFLGENTVEKVIAQKRLQMESATELEKARLQADIKYGEQIIENNKIKRDLQLKEYEHWALWWPKFLLLLGVDWYWFCVFMSATLGLSDFNIVIPTLTEQQEFVSGSVLAYQLLDSTVRRLKR